MNLAKAIEIAKPYEESHSKEVLIHILKGNSFFEKEFQRQLTDKFNREVEEKGLFFIINYERGIHSQTSIRLGYCGKQGYPTISLNIGKKETYY